MVSEKFVNLGYFYKINIIIIINIGLVKNILQVLKHFGLSIILLPTKI